MAHYIALLLSLVLTVGSACREETQRKTAAPASTSTKASRTKTASGGDSGQLIAKQPLSDEQRAALADFVLPGEQWMGVYLGGKKVGYATVVSRPAGPSEDGHWVTTTTMSMNMKAAGNTTKVAIHESRHYAGTGTFPLVYTAFKQDMGGHVDHRIGRVRGGEMQISRVDNGVERAHEVVPGISESLRDLAASMPPSTAKAAVGERKTAVMFSWQERKQRRMTVTTTGVEIRQINGVATKVVTYSSLFDESKLRIMVTVADGGLVLRSTVGAGLVMKAEDRQVATSDVTGLDILADGVPIQRALGNPSKVQQLELVVGLKPSAGGTLDLPTSPAQRVTPAGARRRVSLSVGPGEKVTPKERAAALGSDDVMDADHPTIKATAARVTAGASTRRERVNKLIRFVFDTIDKRLATHLPSASTVLRKRVGDCTEHTWLFVALARALKIPARPAYGLMYLGDKQKRFGYHAWAEVELDGRWVAVDAAWNQEVADATHLKLGSDFESVGMVMGGLTLEVVDPSSSQP